MPYVMFPDLLKKLAPFYINLLIGYLNYTKRDHLHLEGFEDIVTVENAKKAAQFYGSFECRNFLLVDTRYAMVLYASLKLTAKLIATEYGKEYTKSFGKDRNEIMAEIVIHNLHILKELSFDGMWKPEEFKKRIDAIEL